MSAVKTKGLSVLRRIGGFLVAAPGENDAGKAGLNAGGARCSAMPFP